VVLQHIAVSQNIPKHPRVLFNDGGVGNDIDYPLHAVGHCMTQGKGEGGYCFPAAGGHRQRVNAFWFTARIHAGV